MGILSFQTITVEADQTGKLKVIGSVEDAADFLAYGWPKKRGPYYLEARAACYEALQGLITIDEARVRFVEACIEADIYVREGH